QESKAVFDVLLADPDRPGVRYGVSCKMRATLNRITDNDGRVTIEVSNSSRYFWAHLGTHGIRPDNYRECPSEVGAALVELVATWHEVAALKPGAAVDVTRSCYLVLSYNAAGTYQLHQFPLRLPNPATLRWECPPRRTRSGPAPGQRIVGHDPAGVLI